MTASPGLPGRIVHFVAARTLRLAPTAWLTAPVEAAMPRALPGDVLLLGGDALFGQPDGVLLRWSIGHPLVPVLRATACRAGSWVDGPPADGWLLDCHPAAVDAILDELLADPLCLPGMGAQHVGTPLRTSDTIAARGLALLFGSRGPGPTLSEAARRLPTSSAALAHAARRDAGCTWNGARRLRATALLLHVVLWRSASVAAAAREVGLSEPAARRLTRGVDWRALVRGPGARERLRAFLVAARRRLLGRDAGAGPVRGLSDESIPGTGADHLTGAPSGPDPAAARDRDGHAVRAGRVPAGSGRTRDA
jgi:hypothetical protein